MDKPGEWQNGMGYHYAYRLLILFPAARRMMFYVGYLDRAAKIFGDLKGKDGEAIPILFRALSWAKPAPGFGWCKKYPAPQDEF